MKVEQIKSKVGAGHAPCRHCGLAVKPGQWVMRQKFPNNPITDRTVTFHVACMRKLIADVPDDVNLNTQKIGFDRLREKIAASGHAFPD